MPTATTLGGWAAVIAVAAAYYYINQNASKTRRPLQVKPSSKPVESRKEPKAKKARKDGGASNEQDVKHGQKAQKKKTQPTKVGGDQSLAATPATIFHGNDKDEIDNREFARQLSNAKTGTILASKSQTENHPKSIKQTKAQDKSAAETSSDNATAPSSTTGGDADDDQSPINSPELTSTSMATPVAAGGVSDMLEKPAPGPSVLRVTSPTNPTEPKKPKAPVSFETAETKKQRQNRKKAEAQKLAREEDEKIRKVQLEKQRRTAREAEGRAAKDGSAFMAAKTPSTSAWTAPAAATNGNNATSNKQLELLDTYEPPKSNTSIKPADGKATTGKKQDNSPLSEEEQLALAYAESRDANWEVVKAAKRKAKKENQPLKEDKQSSADEKSDFSVPPVVAPTGPGKKWKSDLVHVDSNGEVKETSVVLQDSEWEVA